jgi:hypothetical protein
MCWSYPLSFLRKLFVDPKLIETLISQKKVNRCNLKAFQINYPSLVLDIILLLN